ncbi:hypothetical protein FW774_01270 (plasmid) [Pedobacter sp. BS3]|uniref:hypothetical protein n=1 Tax=Pedobacter sp. BS3 TaxID=2567937 RepID=UPI0011EDC124|nr:hypothetical protein [Pedobacter sp. BS3]TZF85733.1 hypothetical protein FW774_01270 [Pedobacter sp. BS3]
MANSIKTFADLQERIQVLRLKTEVEERVIAEKFHSPAATFSTILSLFKGKGNQSFLQEIIHEDFVTAISRFVLPTLLNSVFFRKSNFIIKALVTLFSQKAAKNIDSNVLTDVVSKVKSFFQKLNFKKKDRSQPVKDYGIPPYSETY